MKLNSRERMTYVRYEALERFLNELEAERKAFKGQDETEE